MDFARLLEKRNTVLSGADAPAAPPADIRPPEGLTEDQAIAYGAILERLENGARFTTLRGYAGTGKTYLTGKLIDALTGTAQMVYVTAPTHKAAAVLRQKIVRRDVSIQTIHSFLGLKLVQDGKGGYVLRRDWGVEVPTRGIVFVDESSMVGDTLWEHIEHSPEHLQWVFIGDPAQLPPVNEENSPIFEIEGFALTDVVRQAAGNPIIELATEIREATNAAAVPIRQVFRDGIGIGTTRLQEDFVARAVHAFQSEGFHEDSTYARVLAYRNRVVNEYNREIRRRLYGSEADRFVEGEWLVAAETWSQYGKPVLINSEEVRVNRVREASASLLVRSRDQTLFGDDTSWKVWELDVQGRGDVFERTILVLHEIEQARYEKAIYAARQKAYGGGGWDLFYSLKEAFARVEYLYAMTVHKSQGSTFHTAFVDWQDLRNSGKEQAALMYVAATRPSHRLALLV